MINLSWLEQNADIAKQGFSSKGYDVPVDRILELSARRRELLPVVEAAAAKKNAASKEIASVSSEERAKLIAGLRVVDEQHDRDRELLAEVELELNALVWSVPNLPASDVYEGKDETGNTVLRAVGDAPVFSFAPRAHWEIGPALGLYDTERAAKVSGSRFGYLLGQGALLEFALIRLAMDMAVEEGFLPAIPPTLVRDASMDAMGYTLHGGQQETYFLERDSQYLVGTAEQSMGPYHMDEILEADELPKRYVAFSTCFRREAGSYGKDTKGIFRVHQFDKVELFSFTASEQSDQEHEALLAFEERFLQALKLPYQVVKMCTGDLGVQASRKYDLEAWFPSEDRYRELTSTSNCTDWQARRLNIRVRTEGGTKFAHTLNGTAVAIGRTISCLLECGQQKDGSVKLPDVLHGPMGTDTISVRH
jgi:seryl-tRNA synthetase